jgi:hypothetical protein
MKTGSEEIRRHQSGLLSTGVETHKAPLCAVPPGLQLKYQDFGITVTNWDRIRLNRKPNYSC